MNAPLRQFDFIGAEPERRRESRADCTVPPRASAMLTMAAKAPCPAHVSDVSIHGCCVETAAEWLRPGRFVAITLADGAALESIVRWSGNGLAGLEWLRPIDTGSLASLG